MAGDSDEEAVGDDFAEAGGGGRTFREVDAVGSAGEGEVGAGVDEDAGGMWIRKEEDALEEAHEVAGLKVLFADLDELDSFAQAALDVEEEGFGSAGGVAVGDVAADQASISSQ